MSLAQISIKRPIFITCIVTLMLILGGSSMSRMSVDLFPDVSFPVLFIQTVYPGASPVDMEKLVSKPIEDELASLQGLETLSSNNLESISFVILKFRLGTDLKATEQTVRDRVSNIRRKLPTEIEDPTIRKFDPADQPIMRLAVSSNIPAGQLYDIIDETIRPQFERIQGVGQVKIIGGRKTEIQILVDKNKLQDRKLSLLQVSDKVKATSKDVPVGTVTRNERETVLRTLGEFSSVEALQKVNVNFVGSDIPVLINQIGVVKEGLEDEKTRSYLNGSPALFMEIFKQSGANTIKVADTVVKNIDKVNAFLAEKKIDAKMTMVRDGAWPVRLNVQDVTESIIIGILLTVVVVFFFLGSARSTFITGMALPNSLLGAFIIMYICGFSINIMTLLSLSLAVGLLIDDAIVVRENIFRHMEMGKSPKQAALEGTNEVTLAVVATTFVVIAVFGPVAFLDGIVGQFFKEFGLTVVFAMLISLFDAFTVAPMLSAYMATSANIHKKNNGFVGKILASFERFQTGLENRYEKILKFTLNKPAVTLGAGVVIFVLSLGLVAKIPKTFLPPADNGEFQVNIEMPSGYNLDATETLAKKLETEVMQHPAIELAGTTVGTTDGEVNKASIYVKLKAKKNRNQTTSQVKDDFRKSFKNLKTEGIVSVNDFDPVNSGQKPFNLIVRGENLEEISEYSKKLVERFKKIPGLVDIDTNFRSGKPEYHVVFDRGLSESLGISTSTAGGELRARVEGVVPATYRKNGREYDIRVRLQEDQRDLRKEFESTFVPNVNFNMIPLSRVAKGEETLGFSQINRQNKGRYINIAAALGSNGSLGNITTEVENILKSELVPPTGVETKFDGQAEDFKDLMVNMLFAIFMGIVFIYLVLASLYESFITPFTILLALPMAMTGALGALFITGKSIDIFSLIGIIMLLGVVAKNSILLVDYTVQKMDEGMERKEALLAAGRTRLRPILMTSIALIAGVVPIAIGLNEASAQRTSMGVAIIGGLISSTVLTLLVVPAAFGYIDNFRLRLGRFMLRLRDGKPKPAGAHSNGYEAHDSVVNVK